MRHAKRRKHTKRAKYTRHTKHRGKQYKNKRTYRKHPRKLKHKSRLQNGGYDYTPNEEYSVPGQIMISYKKAERSGLLGVFKDKNRQFIEPFEVTVKLTKISNIPFTYEEFISYSPILKDKEERIEQDDIWKKICEELDWEFINTV